jgi:Uma2 family endonuclease
MGAGAMVAQTIPEDRPLTIEDFFALPDDGLHYQLLTGELILSPSPEIMHQRISRRLIVRLDAEIQSSGFGEVFHTPTAVVLSKNDVVEPDLFVIRSDQQSQLTRHVFNGAPPIVFEILSPSNRRMDLQRKALLYANAGIEEYWMIDPEKQRILIQRLIEGKVDLEIFTSGSVTSTVLPGFTVGIDALFS